MHTAAHTHTDKTIENTFNKIQLHDVQHHIELENRTHAVRSISVPPPPPTATTTSNLYGIQIN